MSTVNNTLPAHIAFQCEDKKEKTVLVNTDLFTIPGNIPSHNWFAYTFSGKTRLPQPLRTDGDTPVFYLPIPRLVFLELLQLLRLPVLMEDAWDHVPLSLKNSHRLGVWRAYLERYNFVSPVVTSAQTTKKVKVFDEKTKKLEVLQKLEEKPAFSYVRRLCEAIVNEMRLHNPDYLALVAGQRERIDCHFIHTFNNYSQDGNLTYKITIDGEPPIPTPADPAWELGMSIKNDWNLYENSDKPMTCYVEFCLQRALGDEYAIYTSMALRRTSKAKTRFVLQGWPAARNTSITPGDHDVWEITISRRSQPSPPLDDMLRSHIKLPVQPKEDEEEDDESV